MGTTAVPSRFPVPTPIPNSHQFTFTSPSPRRLCLVCPLPNYSLHTSKLAAKLITSCLPSCRPLACCQSDTTSSTRSQICLPICHASSTRPAFSYNNHHHLGPDERLLVLALLLFSSSLLCHVLWDVFASGIAPCDFFTSNTCGAYLPPLHIHHPVLSASQKKTYTQNDRLTNTR